MSISVPHETLLVAGKAPCWFSCDLCSPCTFRCMALCFTPLMNLIALCLNAFPDTHVTQIDGSELIWGECFSCMFSWRMESECPAISFVNMSCMRASQSTAGAHTFPTSVFCRLRQPDQQPALDHPPTRLTRSCEDLAPQQQDMMSQTCMCRVMGHHELQL